MANPFQNFRDRLADSRRRHAAFRRTYSELSSMSQRELTDLGIAPSDIGQLAAEAARRA